MSHFTHIKTRFQNLSYLEKALNRLIEVDYTVRIQTLTNLSSKL